MEYLVLIYSDEAIEARMSQAEGAAYLASFGTYTATLADQGVMRGGNALEAVSTATTVRVRDGKTLITDGPFAETKEQLGGYFLIEAKDLDEALGHAAAIPTAAHGSIEVRPVMMLPWTHTPTQGEA